MKNHAGDIWACDFTVAHDLLFRPLYIFVVLQLQTRRIVHTAVTGSPTDDWTAQQLCEATPWGKGPKYLVRDRDNKYSPLFPNVAKSTGIQMLRAPVRAPRANAICERFIGSLRREYLDHLFMLHSYQLHRIVRVYADYYNYSRPHHKSWMARSGYPPQVISLLEGRFHSVWETSSIWQIGEGRLVRDLSNYR